MSKNGLILIKPTSISTSGGTASISTNGSVTFSGSGGITFNQVFSNLYDNYLIVGNHANSAAASLRMRLSNYGGSTSLADYYDQLLGIYNSTISPVSQSSRSEFALGSSTANYYGGHVIRVFGPYLPQNTAVRAVDTGPWSSAYPYYMNYTSNYHNVATPYDSCIIYPGAGTLTGTFCIYGLRN